MFKPATLVPNRAKQHLCSLIHVRNSNVELQHWAFFVYYSTLKLLFCTLIVINANMKNNKLSFFIDEGTISMNLLHCNIRTWIGKIFKIFKLFWKMFYSHFNRLLLDKKVLWLFYENSYELSHFRCSRKYLCIDSNILYFNLRLIKCVNFLALQIFYRANLCLKGFSEMKHFEVEFYKQTL